MKGDVLNFITNEEILNQIKSEFIQSFNFVLNKRYLIRNRYRLYNEVVKDPSKISSNIIYLMMQTMLSVDVSNDMDVEFSSRTSYNEEAVENIQALAEFDYDEMGLDEANYWIKWYKRFTGIGLVTFDSWDKISKVPSISVRDPLTRLPDLSIGFNSNKLQKRYHGFQKEDLMENLIDNEYYFQDQVKLLSTGINSEVYLNKVYMLQNRGLNISPELIKRGCLPLYTAYTVLKDGYKYLIETDQTFTFIIRCERLQAVLGEEKADKRNIVFPVVEYLYSPYPGDPFGVSLPDLVEDKQRAKSVILNLNKIKATREALGGIYLYDKDAIGNKIDLQTPNPDGPKFIGINGSRFGGLDKVILEVQQQRLNPDAINFPEVIMNEIYLSTGMDQRGLGISQPGGITMGENQRLQANQNLKLLLNQKINGFGEKKFWGLWYKFYQEFMSKDDKKIIEVEGGYLNNNQEFTKSDITCKQSPRVKIINKYEKLQENETQKASLMALLSLFLQDPTTPNSTKQFLKRKTLKVYGWSKSDIDFTVSPDADEIKAKYGLELINNDIDPEPIKDMMEDHQTYINIRSGAKDTPVKSVAINSRLQAIGYQKEIMAQQEMQQRQMSGGMSQPNQPAGGNPGNIAQNQLVNRAMSDITRNQARSMADVSGGQ